MPFKPRQRLLPCSSLLLSAALGCAGPAPEQDPAQPLASEASRLSTPGLPPGLAPSLVKDIQVGPDPRLGSWNQGSWPDRDGAPAPVPLGSTLYFTALEESTGQEPWRTDGTPEGTRLVRELIPGNNFGDITGLATVGNSLFITTESSLSDGALWKSDGTPEGTVRFGSREDWTLPGHLITCNGQLFFQDHQFGGGTFQGLWKTDGTLEGTVQLSSRQWGFAQMYTSSTFTCAGGTLFFVAFDESWNQELWKSDGTAGGTTRVATLSRVMIPYGDEPMLFAAGSRVFIPAMNGVWTSDGTPEGTTLLHGEGSPEPLHYATTPISVGDRFYFTAFDDLYRPGMWTSDCTEAGTRMLTVLPWGPQPGLVSLGDTLLLSAGDGVYRSNGTPEGTVLLDNLSLRLGSEESARLPDGRWLITTSEDSGAPSLWVTDGTRAGTTPLQPAQGQGFVRIQAPTRHGDAVLFWADDGVHGMEPWVTDGTPEGTRMIHDIFRADSSRPQSLLDVDGTLYFTAYDAGHGRELWKSDGTAEGTRLVKDLNPVVTSDGPYGLTRVGQTLFFFSQRQLWKSDGTEAGTLPVFTSPGYGTFGTTTGSLGAAFFFTHFTSTAGWELWTSDGTPEGTVLVEDINPGRAGGAGSVAMVQVGNSLFFMANDGVHGQELWKTDGTPEGTVLVKDIRPGTLGSSPGISGLVNAEGTLFFAANDGVHGLELWKSDGTPEGTQLVADVHRDNAHFPSGLVAREGTVFFTANDGVHGDELWTSDGTAAGTRLVADIAPGTRSALMPYGMQVIDGTVYFAADDGVHGTELWKSDGTAAGTALLRELTPGAAGTALQGVSLVPVGPQGTFAFQAPEAGGGLELWTSDGTTEGTRPLHDIAPGGRGSTPSRLTVSGPRLFFVADEGEHGQELWSVKHAAFQQRP
jgi:ELWxxDGT repeat protein